MGKYTIAEIEKSFSLNSLMLNLLTDLKTMIEKAFNKL